MIQNLGPLVSVEKVTNKQGYCQIVNIHLCFKCNETKVRVRKGDTAVSGMCRTCSKRKSPFLTNYKKLFRDYRKTLVLLTYEEFIEFTLIKNCHYCDSVIKWNPYHTKDNNSCAYYLDRKDNDGPYSKENCVVCCTTCNRMRSNKFSYDEFFKFRPVLVQIMKERN